MGAAGSTAVSCSSLDLANNRQYLRHHQHLLHEQRMLKYRKQAKGLPPTKATKSNLLKHSSSNFDLTQNHLIHQPTTTSDGQHHISKLSAAGGWLDSGDTSQMQDHHQMAYSLSNANYGAGRPIMVLPNSKPMSPVHILSGAKRSNAGVASRIHQQNQRQLDRASQLRKFSDSLPSLNNMLSQQSPPNDELISPVSSYAHSPPINSAYSRKQQQQERLMNHKSAKYNQKQQQLIMQQSHIGGRSSNHPNVNLVNRCDDPSYRHWSSAGGEQQHLMKRATSLSSLHNTHNHQQYHDNYRQRQAHAVDYENNLCSKQSMSNCNAAQSHTRNELFNNNMTSDLQQHAINRHQIGFAKQQQQYNQPTPLAKKILKFKQVAGNGLSSKKYKQKQKIQQQQQQQGCPVLPPLPRSQSLHELIQLRATENGQRMRTTGTLRGPLGAGEASNKVNLVVELLENRRQQKMNEQQAMTSDSIENTLSQASSSDDGIHDVSLTLDQSTGDSRHKYSPDEGSNVSENHISRHRLSLTSQGGERDVKRGVFTKNQLPSNLNQRRFNGSPNQLCERPQSQKIEQNRLQKFNQYQPSKSTLKRSASHSALQNSLHSLDVNNDEDESDDLNELAKFLYQFKQRQANKSSEAARSPNQTGINSQSSSNQQQSPNSTTSSSGFASSTCTSNSISSSGSDELGHKIEQSRVKKSENPQALRQPSRKKYPAPLRPDEKTVNSPTKVREQITTTTNNNGKNLISGQLKLSSSLLSIVDEYSSTLQSNNRASPALNLKDSSNLASVLLGEANGLKVDKKLQPEAKSTNSSDRSSSSTAAYCLQQQQIEQLRRYTQMRQMSQSELALNHLTSSSNPKTLVKGKRDQCEQRSSSKPYKSKLINIIRRISDKSEVAEGSSSNSRSSSVTVGGNQKTGKAANKLADPEFQPGGLINQSETMAPYSNQCKKQKHNHGKFLKTPCGKSCLSESLCDLNFDCDFELIKNCGSTTSEHRGAAASTSAAGLSGGSLLVEPSYIEGGAERRCEREMGKKHHQQIINSLKVENNWKLVSTSLSLDKPTSSGAGKEIQHQQRLPVRQSMNETDGSSKGKPLASATDKLAGQSKLKWSASSCLMKDSGCNDGGSSCGSDRTKGKELEKRRQPQATGGGSGKSCLSKLISNSRTPLSAANNNGAMTKELEEKALIESKSFAKVNSEAKQLLNELDQSLAMVSGRYPFSRNTALSWWKMDENLTTSCTNDQLVFRGGRLAHRSEFASSSSDSDFNHNDEDDDDDEDYASLNRAMINATFGVDVNQTKQTTNDNLNSLSIEPGSPSDSFTFSAPNSPIMTHTNAAATTKLPAGSIEFIQSTEENHISTHSKDSKVNGSASSGKQLMHQQMRNSGQNGSGNSSQGVISTASASRTVTSQTGGGQHSADVIGGKSVDNGATFVGGVSKRIVSYDEMMSRPEGGVGKVELNREDGEIKGKRIGTASESATVGSRTTNERSAGNKLTSGIGVNQDLCAHDQQHEISAKKQQHCHAFRGLNCATSHNNDNHDSYCEQNLTRCLMGGRSSGQFGAKSNPKTTASIEADSNDIRANVNGNNIDSHGADITASRQCSNGGNKSNRSLSKCQINGGGKNPPAVGMLRCWSPRSSLTEADCHICGNGPTPNDRVKGANCRGWCHGSRGGSGVKSNGSSNGLSTQKLDIDERCDFCTIQGQGSCSRPGELSGCRYCCMLSADTIAFKDNEKNIGMNGQKHSAVKCNGTQSSPREQLGSTNNGRQMVAAKSEPFRMRSSNLGSSVCTASKGYNGKEANKYCSNAPGCGDSGSCCCENILGKPRDFHANGVTYSKTTASTAKELKNKLITQQKPGTCHCSSVVSNTSTEVASDSANDSQIGKDKTVVTGGVYHLASARHALASSNSSPKPDNACMAATEPANFYYYEMGRNVLCSNDKQTTATDKTSSGVKRLEQQHQQVDLHAAESFAAASAVSSRTTNSENRCCDEATCAVAEISECKVASCHHHHPSSRLSSSSGVGNFCDRVKTNYDEDVKSRGCVSRDNLILETGHRFEGVESSSVEHRPSPLLGRSESGGENGSISEVVQTSKCSPKMACGGNCRCCLLPMSQNQQHTQLHHSKSKVAPENLEPNGKLVKCSRADGLVGRFSSPNQVTVNGGEAHLNSKPSQNGRPLCAAGATRLISKSRQPGKPICRSNSELVPSLDKGMRNAVNIKQSSCLQNKPPKEPQRHLFGRLRNSFLNQASPITAESAIGKSSKLACSQISLVNYYNGSHFVSPFIAHQAKTNQAQLPQYHHYGSTTALTDQTNVDDNFILRRKTPNAGLKSRG